MASCFTLLFRGIKSPMDTENEILVIPDIHGQKLLLEMILRNHPTQHYVFLGDVIDRGENSRWCLRTALELQRDGRATLCIGNHEIMAWNHFFTGERNWWTVNGLPDCRRSWDSEIEMKHDIGDYVEAAHHYHVIEDMMFAHAGAPFLSGDKVMGEAHLWDRPTERLNPLPPHVLKSFHGHTPFRVLKILSDGSTKRIYLDSPTKTVKVMNPRTLQYWTYGHSA